ncbi:hypothetical protein [Thioalkalivibrio thiocyanodenitrificans]|uniref:hypothetical protein n=1 Tax=Thioalkalivibrio thiocyanodenitrificans TaxID=243063 RepID=UPI00037983E7|nr:hypothetical protein [Thioalkalivibrio thiocyanodenitrificans]
MKTVWAQIAMRGENLGRIEVTSNDVSWLAIPIDERADEAMNYISDEAFEALVNGEQEVTDRGFSLRVC